jgi:hypothetical protein
MLFLAIAAMGFAFYKVEEERVADAQRAASDANTRAAQGCANVSVRGCSCNGGGGTSDEDDFVFVQGRVDPRLRVARFARR